MIQSRGGDPPVEGDDMSGMHNLALPGRHSAKL